MDLTQHDEQWPDGAVVRTVVVSGNSDWLLFERVAAALESGLPCKWICRLDGIDQRYWDLEAESGRLTLHLEHYLGITLFASREAPDAEASRLLLYRAIRVLERYDPA